MPFPYTPGSCTDSEENSTTLPEPYSGAGYVASSILLSPDIAMAVSHAIHTHESCMHVACGEGSALKRIHLDPIVVINTVI